MKTRLLTALAACALLGAGCFSGKIQQAYPGASRPVTETCTLCVPSLLEIRAIDDVSTDWSLRIKKDQLQRLSLLSGSHRLLVRYYDPTADESRHEVYDAGPFEVGFVADSGSVQELKCETASSNPELRKTKQKVRVWVEPVSSGTPASVARPRPSPAILFAPVQLDLPGADHASVATLKSDWQALSPSDREAFRKWLLAQP